MYTYVNISRQYKFYISNIIITYRQYYNKDYYNNCNNNNNTNGYTYSLLLLSLISNTYRYYYK